MTEQYATEVAVAFQNALQDAAMLQPTSLGTSKLFDPAIFDIQQEAEGSINQSGASFAVPLAKILIIVHTPYGKRSSYMSKEFDEDWLLSMKLRIYGNTGADITDTRRRFEFATMHRNDVFSSYGIYETGQDEHPRMRPYDSRLGFASLDYILRFRWAPN